MGLSGHPPWPELSNYAGKRVAETLDQKKAFAELEAFAIEGSARLSELARIGKTIHPRAIQPDSEEATILRQLFFGDNSTLCQGQQAEHIQWRRASLFLMLQYLREAGVIEDSRIGMPGIMLTTVLTSVAEKLSVPSSGPAIGVLLMLIIALAIPAGNFIFYLGIGLVIAKLVRALRGKA